MTWHGQAKVLYVALNNGAVHAVRKDKASNQVVWRVASERTDEDDVSIALWVERMQFSVGTNDTPLLVAHLRSTQPLYEVSRTSVAFLSFTGDGTPLVRLCFLSLQYITMMVYACRISRL